MKEAIVFPGPTVEIMESHIPTPLPHQLLIQVNVPGFKPKDWKQPEWFNKAHNSGGDIDGTVEIAGDQVTGFEVVLGSLLGEEKGSKDLKAGKNKASKYIFEIVLNPAASPIEQFIYFT